MDTRIREEDSCCFSAARKGGLRVLWEITHRCNLKCIHCLISERLQELSKENCLRIAKILVADGAKKVLISGGEPLLHPACLEIAEVFAHAGIETDLITNATLLTEKTIWFLGQKGIDCSISLDGPDAKIHDPIRGTFSTFDRVITAITRLVQSGVNVQALMSVTAMNWKYARETIDLANTLGCSSITLMGLLPLGKAKVVEDLWLDEWEVDKLRQIVTKARQDYQEHLKIRATRLFARPPLNHCLAGRTFVHIDPEGKVNPCPLFVLPKTDGLSLPTMGLKEVLNHSHYQEIKKSLTMNALKHTTPCPPSCSYYDQCGRGCRGLARFGLDPLCPFYEKISRGNDKQ